MFNNNIDLNADIFRNIVSLIKTVNVFDDLIPKEQLAQGTHIATAMVARVRQNIPEGAAITFPFETQPYMSTRYGDGSYGVWYGSLLEETTLHETAYHMFQDELSIEGIQGTVYRERAVFKVHAQALLVDLRGQEKQHPDLIADHYELTHAIGARLQREGHPGLVTSSARHHGANVVAFNPDILSKPTLLYYLIYQLDVDKKVIRVSDQKGKVIAEICENSPV